MRYNGYGLKVVKKLKRLLHKRHHRWLAGVAAFAFSAFLAGGYIQSRTQRPLELKYAARGLGITAPLQIQFTQEVQAGFNYNLIPGTAGRWEETAGLFGVTGLVFYPDQPLKYGQSYLVQMTDMKRPITGGGLPNHAARVVTEVAPDIESFYPADETGGVPRDVNLRLRVRRGTQRLIAIKLTPETPLQLVSQNDNEYIWRPKVPLKQGVTYQAIISDPSEPDQERRQLYTSSFTTVAQPKVTEATQTDHYYAGAPLRVKFDREMEQLDSSVKFEMPGVGQWVDATTYEFVPRELKPGTAYSYRVVAGARSVEGGAFESDAAFTISTPGQVYLTASSPSGGSVGLGETVAATFDQPVERASAEAAFQIAPSVTGTFSWQDNRLTFKPSSLEFQTTYTVSFRAGIKAIHGLPNAATLNYQFTTAARVLKLSVPYYRQQHYLSCEEAALRMALAFRGVYATDMEIVARVGYNPRPRDIATNTWDDPYQMFVGDIDGIQGKTGWGVYAEPIAKAARSYGRGASAHSNVSARFLAEQVYAGNPVVIWGYWNKSPRADFWNLPGGGQVNGYYGEHARTVIGVVGRADNPAGFYIHDPLDGSVGEYWPATTLIDHMNVFGGVSNQAVVVN